MDRLLEADHDGRGGGHQDGGLRVFPLHQGSEQTGQKRRGKRGAARMPAGGVREMQCGEVEAHEGEHDGQHGRSMVLAEEGGDAAQDGPERVGADAAEIRLSAGRHFLIAPLADQAHQRAKAGAHHN